MDKKRKRSIKTPIPTGPAENRHDTHGLLDERSSDNMMTVPDPDLRCKAEKLALHCESNQDNPLPGFSGTEEPILHELLVHQIELELQNEELIATQAQLEAARARYFELYDLAPVGYIILSQEGIIEEANITAASILGLEKKNILNQPFTRFILKKDQDLYYLRNRKLFSTLEPQVFELRVNRADQQIRWIQLTETVAEMAGDGQVCRMVLSDITDRKAAEDMAIRAEERAMALVEKLQRSDQNKNKFLNVLSHELRNPLAAITMSLSLQEMAMPGSDAAIRAGEVLKRQTAQLTNLVDDLLDITRISQNKITLKKKPVDLVELVQRVVSDFLPSFAAKGIELVHCMPDAPIRLLADSVRLNQVIGNLLHNALKFSNAGGKVVVTLKVARQTVNHSEAILQVVDNGVGMTREFQQELFQPFVQADNSLSRSEGGLGLGLAVVKGLVEMHGGHVVASSAGPGQGSEFSIHLPIVNEESDAMPTTPAGNRVPARPLRILLIEDNSDLRQIILELLGLLGHEVSAVSTGMDGINRATSSHPDVVICDIGLPGISGYAVARVLSQNSNQKRPFLIAMTGYAQSEDIARSKAAGFDRHLSKPIDLTSLKQILTNIEL